MKRAEMFRPAGYSDGEGSDSDGFCPPPSQVRGAAGDGGRLGGRPREKLPRVTNLTGEIEEAQLERYKIEKNVPIEEKYNIFELKDVWRKCKYQE